MATENVKKKMIIAILQGDDFADTIEELNRAGFFATVLSSSGGFLKKRSMTLMIGVNADQLDAAISVLRQCAGKRDQMAYSDLSMSTGGTSPAIPMVPVQMNVGGVVVFVLDLDDIQKF